MRITFVAPPVSLNGGSRVIAIYAENLSRMGHSVCVVSPPHQKPSFRNILKDLRSGYFVFPRHYQPSSHFDHRSFHHLVLERSRPVVETDLPDADIVVATWWETAEWVDKFAPKKGAKVYLIQHHETFEYLPTERVRATYRFPFHKIVVASWLKTLMAQEYGDKCVSLVPNSVDLSQFSAPVRTKQLLPTVGFLYSESAFKGLDLTLAALDAVKLRIPNLHLISFGSVTPTRFKLPPYATFIKSPSQERIKDIYAACDVWLTASRSEGFNLPAMEAMACRTPVISTRTGWPEEAIRSGENGILVDINDSEGLRKAIECILLLPPDEWSKISLNAYETVLTSSWEKSTKQFEQALFLAIDRSAKGEIA